MNLFLAATSKLSFVVKKDIIISTFMEATALYTALVRYRKLFSYFYRL